MKIELINGDGEIKTIYANYQVAVYITSHKGKKYILSDHINGHTELIEVQE